LVIAVPFEMQIPKKTQQKVSNVPENRPETAKLAELISYIIDIGVFSKSIPFTIRASALNRGRTEPGETLSRIDLPRRQEPINLFFEAGFALAIWKQKLGPRVGPCGPPNTRHEPTQTCDERRP
jgi:hypothetical protein